MQRNAVKEIGGERERSKAREDEVVDAGLEWLQAVEQRQLLQVQVVVFPQLRLQVLAADIHHSTHLNSSRSF